MVVLATVFNLLHTTFHGGHYVVWSLPAWQLVYVAVVFYVAPMATTLMLWTRFYEVGAWLLVASMVGSLVFGLAFHFLISGPDNAFTLHPGTWQAPFQVSAILLLLAQGVGCLVALRMLVEPPRSPVAHARPSVGHMGRQGFRNELR